jgi:Conserved in the green lineage and diatoms 27
MHYKFSCPVPQKQRPINEYMELVQSHFFNWPMQKEVVFSQKLMKSFSLVFLFCLPFSSGFYPLNQSLGKLLLLNASVTTFFIFLSLVRLFLAWTYVQRRLYSPFIFYEESGWYDGRVWVKSKKILVQDRFLYTYQVLPAIRRLKKAFILSLSLFSSFLFLWIFS